MDRNESHAMDALEILEAKANELNQLLKALTILTDDERHDVTSYVLEGICVHCGAVAEVCHCMNDE